MEQIRRVFVEKKAGFDVEACGMLADLRDNLGIKTLAGLRLLNRYDMSGLSEAEYHAAKWTVFAEPVADQAYDECIPRAEADALFAMEFLPGQYDQRADSAAQCVQLLTQKERPQVSSAKVILLYGSLSQEELLAIKRYLINPVECREAALEKPLNLRAEEVKPEAVERIAGFALWSEAALEAWRQEQGLAMSLADLKLCQTYFSKEEEREPSVTEIKVLDTYWSDHCRHTTFMTEITDVEFDSGEGCRPIRQAYEEYLADRQAVYGGQERAVCLMDIAVMGMKTLRHAKRLPDLDESEEINACSIVVPALIDGLEEEWLVMFKNETHNHPTEIEPFGGAATCLGGAIRDPLSGRSYVYQAMRLSGSGDPRRPVAETLPGKLSQRRITTGAAAGYSSYGNQIGLATGQVTEVYDEGYVAKRMEIGAVIAAAPRSQVVRLKPAAGDLVILVGGRTGRDGCGGATGSSKEHTEDSLATCGAEVQKGNAPTEHKIQRLFRRSEASRLIKRCNDFGAGGVAVAIGELTDGLRIDLDAVPKKYEGLDGTELAISESQERMAVVVADQDASTFIALAREENLEATVVAVVSEERRLVMTWQGDTIVDLSRDFLDTNGARQESRVKVNALQSDAGYFKAGGGNAELKAAWMERLADLNACSQRGLVERFDSSIGANSVLMPFGGRYQATPAEGMAAKLPLLRGETSTATLMTCGFNPKIATWSPFHGAVYALVEAVAKIVAMGGEYQRVRLTLQEYFERLGQDASKWGKPFSALLGALLVQRRLGIPAIGGKDSMSGTFLDLHVPPTLAAFAVNVADAGRIISPEFKKSGSLLAFVPAPRDGDDLPLWETLTRHWRKVQEMTSGGKVLAAQSVREGGIAVALSRMCFGNRLGVEVRGAWSQAALFAPEYGSLILELAEEVAPEEIAAEGWILLGRTQAEGKICVNGEALLLEELQTAWEKPLEAVFPTQVVQESPAFEELPVEKRTGVKRTGAKLAKPRVLIPVFPGTNCEYDTERAFEQAGASVETLVIRNLTSAAVEESVAALENALGQTQILMLAGGFSAGDEPDGSGKFIATMLRNPRLKEAVHRLLERQDGLALGICNGFQALIKLGLLPYGKICDLPQDSPTLTFNSLGRHVSRMVQTRVAATNSPWLSHLTVGDLHTIPVSHGEGRFQATTQWLEKLALQGQIVTQYVDDDARPTLALPYNPNGSLAAVEGIISPDGRILGKMGHSERCGRHVAKNIPGNQDQGLFKAGVDYYR